MQKISCVGYHATGAGVIDDFFREFDNVAQGCYEAESRLLQDADGISDLEFHLVQVPNRNKTAMVIERFLRYAKDNRRQYEKIYGKEWFQLCLDYVNSITKFIYNGYRIEAIKVKNPLAIYQLWIYKAFNRLKPKMFRHPEWYNYFPGSTAYHASISQDEFLDKTRKFIEILCKHIPHNDKTEFVLIDQLVGVDYPERYMRYVKDLKVIIVDRDPRDLYIHIRNHNDQKLPHNVYQFCEQYRDIRKVQGVVDDSKVMYVRFEDMIYHYDSMTKKVMDFVGVSPSHHITPKKYFDPSKSIKGTQMWKIHKQYTNEIAIIEKRLSDFLYNY